MDKKEFEILFGVKIDKIKKFCVIILPPHRIYEKQFNLKKITKGLIYKYAENSEFSFIFAPMGIPFSGDCVLYLQKSKCKKIFLLGLAGTTSEKHQQNNLFLIQKAFSPDSFSLTIDLKKQFLSTSTNFKFTNTIKNYLKEQNILFENCISLYSLFSEYNFIKENKNIKAGLLDFETFSFYYALNKTQKEGFALLCPTDNIIKKEIHENFGKNKNKTTKTIETFAKKSINLLKFIINETG